MRLLANENFPIEAVDALRSRGHDVAWVRADSPGTSDRQVIKRAAAEGRILVTFDKDFGELAFRERLPAPCGILLFRISPRSPSHVARTAVALIESGRDWTGSFAVIEDDGVRIVPLPSAGGRSR